MLLLIGVVCHNTLGLYIIDCYFFLDFSLVPILEYLFINVNLMLLALGRNCVSGPCFLVIDTGYGEMDP